MNLRNFGRVGIALSVPVVLALAGCGQGDARTTVTSVVRPVATADPCEKPAPLRRGEVVQGDTAGASLPYDAWGLRTLLLQRIPEEFGGLYEESGTLVLLVTRGHQSEVEVVKKEFEASNPRGGRPTYRFDEVTRPLARLEDLRTLLLGKMSQLEARGVVVTRVGPDERANVLDVGLRDDTQAARHAVVSALGACTDELRFSQQDVVPAT